MALSDQMVADGNTPWCVGFESGGATGWPATDWMEDIMLRTAGPDVYDQWVSARDPVQRPGGRDGGRDVRRSDVQGGLRPRWRGPTRRRSRSATLRCRCSTTRRGAGSTVRRASSRAVLPGGTPSPAWTTTGSRSRRSTRRERSSPASSRSSLQRERPEVVDFLEKFMSEDGPVRPGRRAGVVAGLAEHQRRAGLLHEPDPRRRVGGPDRGPRGRARAGSTPRT